MRRYAAAGIGVSGGDADGDTMDEKHKLDRIDLKILTTLQDEARISNHDLAERVGLSPSSCLQRVRKLETRGVLDGYRAHIDLDRICRSVTVIATATLANHDQKSFSRFERAVADIPEVVECLKVSGTFDYILRFVCADMAQYHALSERLLDIGRGVAQLSSHVVLASTKQAGGYPLDHLLQGASE
jgi:DNA-binding Lrp family transcriptional regulator